MAHADYTFAFFDAGRFYRTEAGSTSNGVLPETKYLEEMSGYRRIHYNKFGRVPTGYGSLNFFQRLAANAPLASGVARPPGSVMPYVMCAYPATYYILVAELARIVTFANPRATVATFFIARGLGILVGVGTILLAFSIFQNLRFTTPLSLLSVAGVALLPLFSWVSAYVQPDTFVIFLVTLATWSVYQKRASLPWLSFAVCGLCLVKVHYGVALWVPSLIYAMGFAHRGRFGAVQIALLMGVLPLASAAVSFQLTPVSSGLSNVADTVGGIDLPKLGFAGFVQSLETTLASIYFGGAVFTNYWFGYGTHGFYLTKAQSVRLAFAVSTITVPLLFACILLFVSRIHRITRVGIRRGFRIALRLLGSGFAVNVYIAYTILLLGASTVAKIPLSLEARYWLPLLVPTTIIVVRELPRALPRRFRLRVAFVVASVALVLAAPIDAASPWVIERDYYGSRLEQPQYNFGGLVVNGSGDAASFHTQESYARIDQIVTIRGFALDIVSGLPTDRVVVRSDGRFVALARRFRWDVDPAAEWHDDALESAGFEVEIPAKALGVGPHDLSVVAERRGEAARPLEHHVELVVTPS